MKTRNKRKNWGRTVYAVALALLLLPALGGYLCQNRTSRICERAVALAGKAAEEALGGDYSTAEELFIELERLWSEERPYMGVLYDHETANRMGESILRMSVFAGTGAKEALLAEVRVFTCQADALKNADRLTLANLF